MNAAVPTPPPPTPGERFWTGVGGATLVVVIPLSNGITALVAQQEVARSFSVGVLAAFVVAWFLGVLLTWRIPEEHLLKCLLTSVGVPGFLVSIATATQFGG